MSKLEKYEWESLWWEEPENKDKNHILYIRDSISRGTSPKLNALSEELAVDNFATSKAVDNPHFIKSLEVFAAQNPGYKTVLFNNGLHGFHMNSEEYAEYFEKVFLWIKDLFKNAKIYILLSTFTLTDNNDETLLRNKAVKAIAEKYGVEIIDLYSVSEQNRKELSPDKVHFTENGYEILAKTIYAKLQKEIEV